jgi:hypothetical protein
VTRLVPLVAVVALLAACGGGAETTTVVVTETETETETVTETAAGDATALPAAVEETRRGLLEAAESGDVEALEPYVTDRLSYSFGGPVEGGAIEHFRRLEEQGEDPLGTLSRILQLPYTLAQGNYVWPWVYSVQATDLTDYERQLLGELADDFAGTTYLGYRAGISPDGTWIFFVAGD